MANIKCQAHEHGFCEGLVNPHSVIFKSRNLKYPGIQDREVQVNVCNTHFDWIVEKGDNLNKETGLLEMRGKFLDEAIHEDLFSPFHESYPTVSDKYTLLRVEYCDKAHGEEIGFLINGTDIDKFKNFMMIEEDKPVRITQCGLFHFNGETVYELKKVSSEWGLEVIAELLDVFFRPLTRDDYESDDEHINNDCSHMCMVIPPEIKSYFESKLLARRIENFEECLEFINIEVDPIIGFNYIRSMSDKYLFESFRLLTNALINNDEETIREMYLNGQITEEVLWITYVSANHQLFSSSVSSKNLTNNTRIIDMFIKFGLQDELLILAISGERLRYLDRHMRSSHNVLDENEFVVKYLVPRFILPTDMLYTTQRRDTVPMTALEYWNSFSTKLYDECNSVCNYLYSYTPHEFEKNDNIRIYLEGVAKKHL